MATSPHFKKKKTDDSGSEDSDEEDMSSVDSEKLIAMLKEGRNIEKQAKKEIKLIAKSEVNKKKKSMGKLPQVQEVIQNLKSLKKFMTE